MNNLKKDKSISFNSIYIEAPIEQLWWYFSTTQGWNHFLTDVATINGNEDAVITTGDTLETMIGELKNTAICLVSRSPHLLMMEDHFTAILPNGEDWKYTLTTTYKLELIEENITKVSVIVEKYSDDEIMQWIRECGETGWRQTLFNLKCYVELGIDLRNDIFNYPRLGVFNFTATEAQLISQGLWEKGIKGNYIKKVYPNSPAQKAGLQDGDIIIEIQGIEVNTYDELVKTLCRFYKKDSLVEILFCRDREIYTTTVNLTYDDQFTGMIDPTKITFDQLSKQRKERSRPIND